MESYQQSTEGKKRTSENEGGTETATRKIDKPRRVGASRIAYPLHPYGECLHR